MKEIYVNHPANLGIYTDLPIEKSKIFQSIQEAVFSVPKENAQPVIIHIAPGTYREKLVIDRPFIHLKGDSPENTHIVFGDYGKKPWEDGFKCGTFRSYSVFIDTHDLFAENLSFVNDAGPGREVGQAIALYADGDRLSFENCRFLASQDTLFTGPLPPKEIEPGGFRGPKQFAPRINGRHYYHNCFIRGDIDFIFGSATAYFEDCEIFAEKTDTLPAASSIAKQKIYSYLTAASTPKGQDYGYVFANCRLTSNCPKASVYLGRPWRDFAKTVFLNCDMGAHIHPHGFHDWGKKNARNTCFYAEYNSRGAGAAPNARADFVIQLTAEESLIFTKEKVLAGNDGWNGFFNLLSSSADGSFF